MKRAFAITAVAALLVVTVLLHSAIKDFIWTHPWWHSFLVALPMIALPVLAYFELCHSAEANTLRADANSLRVEANNLHKRIAELEEERNRHLQQIARNTERPLTQAERNAGVLRKHLGANVSVTEGQTKWSNAPEIVEVSDDSIVTLFTPRGDSWSFAWCVRVHCAELEITDIPQGSCPLQLTVIKRYGPSVKLGEITKWADRFQLAATPTFAKGSIAYYATYSKPGSPDTRSLYVYASGDGSNTFMLTASAGETVTGDNIEISKRFMALQIEYEAAGFQRGGSGTGSSLHQLFIR